MFDIKKSYKSSNLPLEQRKEKNIWDSIDDFLPVVEDIKTKKWSYKYNPEFRYVDIRIDMRDGRCVFMSEKNRVDISQIKMQDKFNQFDDNYKRTDTNWYDFDKIFEVVEAARERKWEWYKNPNCKYINLHVDMSDCKCRISNDRSGIIDYNYLLIQF